MSRASGMSADTTSSASLDATEFPGLHLRTSECITTPAAKRRPRLYATKTILDVDVVPAPAAESLEIIPETKETGAMPPSGLLLKGEEGASQSSPLKSKCSSSPSEIKEENMGRIENMIKMHNYVKK